MNLHNPRTNQGGIIDSLTYYSLRSPMSQPFKPVIKMMISTHLYRVDE